VSWSEGVHKRRQMSLDWQPSQNQLRCLCKIKDFPMQKVTPEVIQSFKLKWCGRFSTNYLWHHELIKFANHYENHGGLVASEHSA